MEEKQKNLLFYKLTTGMYHLSVCWEGRRKKIVLNMYCSLLNTKYIHVHKYHNVRWFTLKPYKCLCQWTHLREKKGNKMLEVRRGWDGKKLLLFSLLIHREWKKKMLVHVTIRANWQSFVILYGLKQKKLYPKRIMRI